jgi:hypothetical protein
MRIGILTIGSLYWDQSGVRPNWRKDRLESTGERRARVPIRYGRKSNSDKLGGIAATWGRVCLLCNPAAMPPADVLQAWQKQVRAAGASYRAVPHADGEDELLEVTTGCARFGWPIDHNTDQPLVDFDLLLMTATEPTLNNGQYPTARQIADAWRTDNQRNVSYFCNNHAFGISGRKGVSSKHRKSLRWSRIVAGWNSRR